MWSILGGALAVVLAAIWFTGALSALVFGSGWTPIPVAELPATAARLLVHLGEPAEAWPGGARSGLPGPVGFYLTGVVVVAALGAGGVGLWRAAERIGLDPFGAGASRRAPSARWAKARDLRKLRIARPQPGRLTLGRFGGSLIAAEPEQSVIVMAPTRSFKTTGLAIPAILEWDGPVLATSVRNDLLIDTLAHREQMGEVMVFDPAHVTGMARTRATPLWGATSWRGAKKVAKWLASGGRVGSTGLQDADFWFAAAEKLLAPLLLAAASNGKTTETVVRWLDEGPETSEAEVLGLLLGTDVEEATRAYLATQHREDRQRSSVYTTAEMVMAAFSDPFVIEETAAADYSPAALLDGRANTLYLCSPQHEQERLRAVFSWIVEELLAVANETAAATGPLNPRLLLVLDEAANVAPLPKHDELATTAAGNGIQIVSIFHDLAQIKARHGQRALTIANNHRAVIVGSGISDPETLDYASRLIGAGAFEQRSRTAGERGRQSTTEGDSYRDLAPAHVLRQAESGTAVLIYGDLPPAKIRLRPFFQEASLRELSAASPGSAEAREVQ